MTSTRGKLGADGGAARELQINERTMRGYCAGDKVPRVIMLALERLVDLQRKVGGK